MPGKHKELCSNSCTAKINKQINKKTGITTYLSIIHLNVNGLNSLTKRHWEIALKTPSNHLLPARNVPLSQRQTYLNVTVWNMIFQVDRAQKQAGITTFICDKADFKPKSLTRDKEVHFIVIKGHKCTKHRYT
jgi:hypothetical protein